MAPRVPHWLVSVVGALIFLPLLVQIAVEVRSGGPVRALDVFRRAPTAANLRAYENERNESFLAAKKIRPLHGRAFDTLVRRGTNRVIEAKDDWLYYSEDLVFVAAPGLDAIHTVDAHRTEVIRTGAEGAIAHYAAALERAGITLVVVAVPEKATIYPEHLLPGVPPDAAPNNRELVRFLERLAARGMMVIELTAPLLEAKARGVPVFLPRDTHWSPDGARIAAEFVADRIRTLPAFRALEKPRLTSASAADGPKDSRISMFDYRRVEFERHGDLYGMLAYADRGSVFPPMKFVIDQVLPFGGGPAPTGAHDSPILVLGDSFTVIYGDPSLGMGKLGGFAEHLADELDIALDVIAIPAGGPNRSREALGLRRDGIGKKRILVWQFAERDLLNKDVEWHDVPLPAAPAPSSEPATSGPVAAKDGVLSVRARLTAVSKLPERLPYPDCLVITRYETDALASPKFVAAWGRRDWKAVPADTFPIGAMFDLALVPARDRIDLERTCFADTVGLTGDLYWADRVTAVNP